jgi:hypothetical protein
MVDLGCGCDSIELPFGPSGSDGKNVYNVTTGPFVQPPVLSNVTVVVSDSGSFTNQWAAPGNIISIFDSLGEGGFYEVISISGTTQIVVKNLGYTGSSPATTTTILTGAKVVPSGVVGAAGNPGGPGAPGAQGLPGVAITLIKTYSENAALAVPSGVNNVLIPTQVFSAALACPQDGDAARIKGHFLLNGSVSVDPTRVINIDFLISKTPNPLAVIAPLNGNASYNNSLQIKLVPLKETANFTYVSFEVMIKRITSSSSMILVDWKLNNIDLLNQSACFVGSSTATGGVDFNALSTISFGLRSTAVIGSGGIEISKASLTVEKIIQ